MVRKWQAFVASIATICRLWVCPNKQCSFVPFMCLDRSYNEALISAATALPGITPAQEHMQRGLVALQFPVAWSRQADPRCSVIRCRSFHGVIKHRQREWYKGRAKKMDLFLFLSCQSDCCVQRRGRRESLGDRLSVLVVCAKSKRRFTSRDRRLCSFLSTALNYYELLTSRVFFSIIFLFLFV